MDLKYEAEQKLEELQFEIDQLEYGMETDTAKLKRLKDRKKKLEESLGRKTVMEAFGELEEATKVLKDLIENK